MKRTHTLLILGLALPLAAPGAALARTGSLTLGVATSFDAQEQTYDAVVDPDNPDIIIIEERIEEYRALGFTPSVGIVSTGKDDRLELRLAPTFKYDLEESDTDWDANILLAAEKAFSQNWQLRASNSFIRSDYANQLVVDDPEQLFPEEPVDLGDAELADDPGRERYWRNTSRIDSSHSYGDDRSAGIGVDYTILRNESASSTRTEFDRYSLRLSNGHRLNPFWKSLAGFSLVRGEYQEEQRTVREGSEPLNDDLWEYRANIGFENDSFRLNRLLFNVSYTGARYDADDRVESDIYESQLTWRREWSRTWSSALGGGATYYDDGNQDGWGGNGLIDINYRERFSSAGFSLTKGYDVDNFSGSNESSLVDSWDARLRASHQLLESLSIDGQLSYRHEERSFPVLLPSEQDGIFEELRDGYTEERYAAAVGMSYSFLRYYRARIGYTYTEQDSDRPGEDYDDHRVLVSLSWQQEWLRW